MKYLLSLITFLLLNINNSYANQPRPWQVQLQEAATPVMEQISNLDKFQHYVIAAIVAFILLLLLYVCFRFRSSKNPIPSNTSHNAKLEIAWTIIPVLILISIVIPSIKLLYYMDRIPQPDMSLKIVGHQWYWEYQYPEYENFGFDSVIIPEERLKPGELRLLTVDNKVVLPIDTNIRILVTSADVIHSWSVPAFGVKTDAIPGRVNESWLNIKKPGIYYGQCYELCGIGHAFMPIMVEAKSKEDFLKWTKEAKQKFANAFLNKTNLALSH